MGEYFGVDRPVLNLAEVRSFQACVCETTKISGAEISSSPEEVSGELVRFFPTQIIQVTYLLPFRVGFSQNHLKILLLWS